MTAVGGRRLLAGFIVAVLATALSILAVRTFSFLAGIENFASDIRVAAMQPPMPQSRDIVIVALDEATLSQFPYRSPVDRSFLAQLLAMLDQKGAKAIGVDVIFDQPTEDAKDRALKAVFDSMKTPHFIAYTSTSAVVNQSQLAYLDRFVAPRLRAEANVLSDPLDGSVRWINPGGNTPDRPPGFAYKALMLEGKTLPQRQIEIAWRSKPNRETSPFPIYSAATAAFLPADWFRNKIVLVGAVLSMTDRHRTPLAIIDDGDMGRMPGVVVQAHAISQLLEGRTTPRPGLFGSAALTAIAAFFGIALSTLRQSIVIKLALAVVAVGFYWTIAIFGCGQGLPLVPMLAPTIAFMASLWIMDLLIGRAESRQREYIQSMFARYVSPAVVDQLVANPAAARITGERREATFIFTDIANFTGLTERLDPQVHAHMLNRYLNGACDIILRHGGTIDKFIGDAIMVIFNAPLEQPDHAVRAVKCALELDEFAEIFRNDRNREGIPLGITRIGIHSGVATIGNFGSDARTEFTALGDAVNIASRVEGANKTFGTRICCTGAVVEQCHGLEFLPVGEVVLRGKSQPVALWLPVTSDTGAEFASQYKSAFSQLSAGDQNVRRKFAKLAEQKPGDPLVAYHLRRMEAGTMSTLVMMED